MDYPLWFAEGLACCFESPDRLIQGDARLSGVQSTCGRIATIKELMKKGTLLPIEKLIVQSRAEALAGDKLVAYGEGWGLFYYLYKTRSQWDWRNTCSAITRLPCC